MEQNRVKLSRIDENGKGQNMIEISWTERTE